jgi:hypothetical protein
MAGTIAQAEIRLDELGYRFMRSYGANVLHYTNGGKQVLLVRYLSGGYEVFIPASDSLDVETTFDAVSKYTNPEA